MHQEPYHGNKEMLFNYMYVQYVTAYLCQYKQTIDTTWFQG